MDVPLTSAETIVHVSDTDEQPRRMKRCRNVVILSDDEESENECIAKRTRRSVNRRSLREPDLRCKNTTTTAATTSTASSLLSFRSELMYSLIAREFVRSLANVSSTSSVPYTYREVKNMYKRMLSRMGVACKHLEKVDEQLEFELGRKDGEEAGDHPHQKINITEYTYHIDINSIVDVDLKSTVIKYAASIFEELFDMWTAEHRSDTRERLMNSDLVVDIRTLRKRYHSEQFKSKWDTAFRRQHNESKHLLTELGFKDRELLDLILFPQSKIRKSRKRETTPSTLMKTGGERRQQFTCQTKPTVASEIQQKRTVDYAYTDVDCPDKRLVNGWLCSKAERFLPSDEISAAYFDGNLGLSTQHFSTITNKLLVIERDANSAVSLMQRYPQINLVRSELQQVLDYNPTLNNSNLLFLDYMGTLDGNAKDQPIRDLERFLKATTQQTLVLGMTFSKRSKCMGDAKSIIEKDYTTLVSLLDTVGFDIKSEKMHSYKRHAKGGNICFYGFVLERM